MQIKITLMHRWRRVLYTDGKYQKGFFYYFEAALLRKLLQTLQVMCHVGDQCANLLVQEHNLRSTTFNVQNHLETYKNPSKRKQLQPLLSLLLHSLSRLISPSFSIEFKL